MKQESPAVSETSPKSDNLGLVLFPRSDGSPAREFFPQRKSEQVSRSVFPIVWLGPAYASGILL
jgi:hypothetical protein